MGDLEKSNRGFAETSDKEVVRPELGTTFDSLTEVYDFYNLYSLEHGFGIQYGESRLNPEKRKTMQEIVCRCSVRCNFCIDFAAGFKLMKWALIRCVTNDWS